MQTFATFLMDDIRQNDLVKNFLFIRSEYCASLMLKMDSNLHTVPDLIRSSNPMRGADKYFITVVKKETLEKAAFPWESIVYHNNTVLSIDKTSVKFGNLLVLQKSVFLEFRAFSLLVTVNSKHFLIEIPRESLLTQDLTREEDDFLYFPTTRQLALSSVKVTELSDKQAGAVSAQIIEQRIDETNEKLALYLWDRVLTSKLDYDTVFLGYRILNGIMALKGINVDLNSRRPFKSTKEYAVINNELEVVEGFTFSLRGAPINPLLGLVSKNITTLVSNPKQSFMLHLFAFVANQQSTENMGTTKSMMALKDFLQKDYMIQVFNLIQDGVFQKVTNNWDLTIDEISSTIDVMMSWSSVKTTSLGRFWKGRLMNNVIANGLMAFYLKALKQGDPNSNPTPEALTIGKPLLLDMKRFLNQRLCVAQSYGKL